MACFPVPAFGISAISVPLPLQLLDSPCQFALPRLSQSDNQCVLKASFISLMFTECPIDKADRAREHAGQVGNRMTPKILLEKDDNDMRRFLVKALERSGLEARCL